jgi:hypothetical protein
MANGEAARARGGSGSNGNGQGNGQGQAQGQGNGLGHDPIRQLVERLSRVCELCTGETRLARRQCDQCGSECCKAHAARCAYCSLWFCEGCQPEHDQECPFAPDLKTAVQSD